MRDTPPPLFETGTHRAVALTLDHLGELQAFFDTNPEYEQIVAGRLPQTDAAIDELLSTPPDDMPFGRLWNVAFRRRDDGAIEAIASVVDHLLAPGVGHIGLFIVATRLHGQGVAVPMLAALERWMAARGAHWFRLGVVVGNTRAETFWMREGYVELRRRGGILMGERVNTIRVMVKPAPGTHPDFAAYLRLVPRDRPEPDVATLSVPSSGG